MASKQAKIDALVAKITVTIPLADPGGYDAASKAIDSLKVAGGTIDIISKGLARVAKD